MPVETLNPAGLPDVGIYRQVAVATGTRSVYLAGQVARTADGRRFTRQGLTVTWVDGRPPGTPPP